MSLLHNRLSTYRSSLSQQDNGGSHDPLTINTLQHQEFEIGRRFPTLYEDKFNASCNLVDKGVCNKTLEINSGDNDLSLSKKHKDMQIFANSIVHIKSNSPKFMHADGRRWGYFPGLHPYLSFSNFMESFFKKSKCSMRVFMVWNSPPWMYTVRHQRSLESVLFHHPHACVVVFSETVELDFFKEFVKDGYG